MAPGGCSFNEYLLSTYVSPTLFNMYRSGIKLNRQNPCLHEALLYFGETDSNRQLRKTHIRRNMQEEEQLLGARRQFLVFNSTAS